MSGRRSATVWMSVVALSAIAMTGCTATASEGTGGNILGVEPRTIGVVSLGLDSPIGSAHASLIEDAGAALGWEVLVTDGAYDPAKIGAAVQTYVDRGVDAIITESSEAASMRSALLAANAAGIPVIATTGGVEQSDLFTAQFTEDEAKMGQLAGEAIKAAVEKPQVLNLKVSAASSGIVRDDALKAVLDSGSIVDEHDINLGDAIGSTQVAVETALARFPEINAIYAVYDTLLQPTEVMMLRADSDAKVFSYFATPDNLKRLQDADNPLYAVVAVNVAKTGIVAIDQLVAHFENGDDIDANALNSESLEYIVITKDNVAEELGGQSELFPNAEILAPFVKRWSETYGG